MELSHENITRTHSSPPVGTPILALLSVLFLTYFLSDKKMLLTAMCYMDWLKFTRLYVTVTISVEWRSHEIDIVTVTYRRSEF